MEDSVETVENAIEMRLAGTEMESSGMSASEVSLSKLVGGNHFLPTVIGAPKSSRNHSFKTRGNITEGGMIVPIAGKGPDEIGSNLCAELRKPLFSFLDSTADSQLRLYSSIKVCEVDGCLACGKKDPQYRLNDSAIGFSPTGRAISLIFLPIEVCEK